MFSTSIISKLIKQLGANLYTYPGGTIAPLLHEAKKDKIATIVSKNEQGAGYMALAEANLKHSPAFVTVTSGPGITNLITVIADAYYDSAPLIILSGQVGTPDLNRSAQLRQRGFQEVPIVEMVKTITKKTFQPQNVTELAEAIHQAIKISNSGRKGPVLIDLPMNVQLTKINDSELAQFLASNNSVMDNMTLPVEDKLVEKAATFIHQAKKPLILLGAGAQPHWEKVREFVQKSKLPTITSLRGLGVLDKSCFDGWIGHTGTPWANTMLFESDLVLVLGSRLDVRQTGSQTDTLANKKVIHVDIDDSELTHCRVANTLQVHCQLETFIEQLLPLLKPADIAPWKQQVKQLKQQLSLDDIGHDAVGCNPEQILTYINQQLAPHNYLVTTGVGSHQHWAARYIDFDNKKSRLFTSAGHGTMGYGLPTAIGLQYLEQDKLVLCIDGDGSFQMNIQELALIEEFDLKLKILLLDNQRLSLVSQFQNITFADDPTTGNVKNPDFKAIAEAYGLDCFYIDSLNTEVIDNWLNNPKASLLHVQIKHDTPISPMLLGGQELNDMWRHNE